MTSPLTGEFDVVVETAIPAVNLVLAAQHQEGRYLHSERVQIPPGGEADGTGVLGVAEVQISTPTTSLPVARATSRVAVHFQIMTHMQPFPGSAEIPEFIHGELQATVDVERVTSGMGDNITIDLTADDVEVTFTPDSGALPLPPEQRLLVNRVLDNFMRTGFEPLNQRINFPRDGELVVRHWRFKTLPDPARPAAALLLNLREVAPTDADVTGFTHVFLEGGDDFAIGVGRDFLVSTIQSLLRAEIERHLGGFRFTIERCGRDVRVSLNEPEIELIDGQIVIRITGNARRRNNQWNFSLEQPFTFRTVENRTVIVPHDPRIGVDGPGRLRNRLIREAINGLLLSETRDEMIRMAEENLQNMWAGFTGFLDNLGISTLSTTYHSVDIQSDGVIVRGKFAVTWGEVVATYDTTFLHPAPPTRPEPELELNAFRSWIPGGTIQRYRWLYGRTEVTAHTTVEEHQFIARVPDRVLLACRWPPCVCCLEVWGTQGRLPSGAPREVVGRVCSGFGAVPPDVAGAGTSGVRRPVAVFDHSGELTVHIDPWSTWSRLARVTRGASGANLVVHFTGTQPERTVPVVRNALAERRERGSLVFVVAVLDPGALERVGPIGQDVDQGVHLAWAEDFERGWAQAFGVTKAPATFVVNPQGRLVWQQEGQADAASLKSAFDEHLAVGGPLHYRQIRLNVQEEQPSPDFLFEYESGRQMALRTLRGRRVMLNFWTSWSKPSLRELRHLQALHDRFARQGLIILAVNDGEEPNHAREVFRQQGFTFQFVADANRSIARLFGVDCWPTTVSIDEKRVIRHIQFGVTPDG